MSRLKREGDRRKERHNFGFLVFAFMSSVHGRLVLVVSGIFNVGIGLHAHTHTDNIDHFARTVDP